jgi:hypothetical protein
MKSMCMARTCERHRERVEVTYLKSCSRFGRIVGITPCQSSHAELYMSVSRLSLSVDTPIKVFVALSGICY